MDLPLSVLSHSRTRFVDQIYPEEREFPSDVESSMATRGREPRATIFSLLTGGESCWRATGACLLEAVEATRLKYEGTSKYLMMFLAV